MPAAIFMTLDGWKLELADTIAELGTAAVDATCQITSAALEPVENESTTPATMCTPAGTKVLPSGDTLDVTFAQDYSDPAGFAWYLRTNDGATKAFRLTDSAGGTSEGLVGIRKGRRGGPSEETLTADISLPVVPGTLVETPPAP